MPETNPLVAERKDTTTPLAGTFLLEDGEALVQAINDKDWVAGGLAVVGGAFDAAAAASDPIGTLIAMGLGWVLDHVQPFNTWLEQLTGDADQVKAHATTWKNVHKHLQAPAEAMASHVTTDLADMNGRTITAYQGAAGDITHVINAAGTWAGAIGTALDITAFIVQFVHDFVRDAISEVVGSILSYAAELIATLGTAWPIVAEQIATRIASLIGQVGRNVKNLVTSARNLVKKLTDLKTLFHTLKNKLDDPFKNLHKTDTPTPNRTGDDIPFGSRGPGKLGTETPEWAKSDRYIEPDKKHQAAFREAVEEHGATSPDKWINKGNPNFHTRDKDWTYNCGPCSRSFADTYQGGNPIAAFGDKLHGETPTRMHEILGSSEGTPMIKRDPIDPSNPVDPSEFTNSAYERLEQRLGKEPPGTTAIVGVAWEIPGAPRTLSGGHWFNAYVDEAGKVRWADEQLGVVADWPPQYSQDIWSIMATARQSQDSAWKGIDLG